MGIVKVVRWIGLEILISKHMQKSQIQHVEQILAQKRYGTFFFGLQKFWKSNERESSENINYSWYVRHTFTKLGEFSSKLDAFVGHSSLQLSELLEKVVDAGFLDQSNTTNATPLYLQ